jgi:hypothetical protein
MNRPCFGPTFFRHLRQPSSASSTLCDASIHPPPSHLHLSAPQWRLQGRVQTNSLCLCPVTTATIASTPERSASEPSSTHVSASSAFLTTANALLPVGQSSASLSRILSHCTRTNGPSRNAAPSSSAGVDHMRGLRTASSSRPEALAAGLSPMSTTRSDRLARVFIFSLSLHSTRTSRVASFGGSRWSLGSR